MQSNRRMGPMCTAFSGITLLIQGLGLAYLECKLQMSQKSAGSRNPSSRFLYKPLQMLHGNYLCSSSLLQ
jgi:hypothetical protein